MNDKLITLKFKKWETGEIFEIKVFSWNPTYNGVFYRKSTQSAGERSFMPKSEAYFWEAC